VISLTQRISNLKGPDCEGVLQDDPSITVGKLNWMLCAWKVD
jgi:hypothetical protein